MRSALLTIVFVGLCPPSDGTQAHTPAFWRDLAANRFVVPEGQSVDALAREASAYLASPDPELRDDIAYSAFATWIYRDGSVSAATVRALTADWIANLSVGVGEAGTDSVFRRSFSALALALVVARDNNAPSLTREDVAGLLDAALTYLAAERDVRGFDARKGWMHSVAHTADLLKFLARSRHLAVADQQRILAAIAAKLDAVDESLTHGEDERLARGLVSIAARDDFDRAAFGSWLTTLTAPRAANPPTPASLAADENRKHLVVSLHALLTTDPRDTPGLAAARELVRAVLPR
jgi:hypothetical protein